MDAAIRVLIVCEDEQRTSFIHQLLKVDQTITCSFLTKIEDEIFFTADFTHLFQKTDTDVMILCDSFQQFSILELIKLFKQKGITTPTIVVTDRAETRLAVEVIKAGGENFISQQELTSSRLIDAIYSALQTLEENRQLEKVRIENQKLLKAIEQSPVSIVITKAETNLIEYANPMFSTLTGYSHNEIIGQSPKILKSGTKTSEEYKDLWDCILSGQTWEGEFINRKKDGSLYCVSAVISPIKIDNNNEISHYVGIHQDITQQKEAELKLKNYAKRLEKKGKMLEEAYQDIENNIRKAKRLHRHFFPTSFPKIEGIELEAFYEPAHKIGSDYYNFIHTNGQLIIYVVDVSGSGIDGAFINVFIRQKINRYLYVENNYEKVSPKGMLNFLAKHFVNEGFPEEYFACFYVMVLDLSMKQLTYSNAGIQVPPILVSDQQLTPLPLGGLPISSAIPMELLSYEEESLFFKEDSTLMIVTDGIVESLVDGEMFGSERLQQIVLEHSYLPLEELKKIININIEPLLQKQKNDDDITYVMMQHSSPLIDERKFTIESDCQLVEALVNEISEWLVAFTDDVNCILVGFHEIIYNAIEHGNGFDRSKKIEIVISVKKPYILFTVEDEGEGFNWQMQMKRTFDIMNFEERGRGIIFAKEAFDYISYNSKGNKASLYKKM